MEKAQTVIVILLVIAIVFSIASIALNMSLLTFDSFEMPTRTVMVNNVKTSAPTGTGNMAVVIERSG